VFTKPLSLPKYISVPSSSFDLKKIQEKQTKDAGKALDILFKSLVKPQKNG